jgi:hypothetical protein
MPAMLKSTRNYLSRLTASARAWGKGTHHNSTK